MYMLKSIQEHVTMTQTKWHQRTTCLIKCTTSHVHQICELHAGHKHNRPCTSSMYATQSLACLHTWRWVHRTACSHWTKSTMPLLTVAIQACQCINTKTVYSSQGLFTPLTLTLCYFSNKVPHPWHTAAAYQDSAFHIQRRMNEHTAAQFGAVVNDIALPYMKSGHEQNFTHLTHSK